MAESRRKADKRKAKDVEPSEEEKARLTRLDRLALLLYLEGGVAIVVGMVVLSKFLSEGRVETPFLVAAGILFALMLVGILFTWMARRKTQAA